MELLHNLDIFLTNKVFSGFESADFISAGIIGAEAENDWIGMILSSYNSRKFQLDDGSYDLTTTPQLITKITKTTSNDIQFNNTLQTLECGLTLYLINVFYPLDNTIALIKITDETYSIHHFAGSWLPSEEKVMIQMREKFFTEYPTLRQISYHV